MLNTIIKLYLITENFWFKFPQKLRYLLVGGFNTVFAYSILAILIWTYEKINISNNLNLNEEIIANLALFTQYVLCVNVSFITMKYYVFQSKGNWRAEFVKAWSVYIFLYLINAPIMTFLMVTMNLHALVAQAIYLIFSTIITYILHKYYSFRKKENITKL
jgi:putative flippase GtrA